MTLEKKMVLERAKKTFIETFISAIIGSLALIDWNNPEHVINAVLYVVIIPAIATSISAVWNTIKPVIWEQDLPEAVDIKDISPDINPEPSDDIKG